MAAPAWRQPLAIAALTVAVFACHPLVTEAVCEPAYREDLLVAGFTLAAVLVALRHAPQAAADPRFAEPARCVDDLMLTPADAASLARALAASGEG